jgi:hypothetical protein
VLHPASPLLLDESGGVEAVRDPHNRGWWRAPEDTPSTFVFHGKSPTAPTLSPRGPGGVPPKPQSRLEFDGGARADASAAGHTAPPHTHTASDAGGHAGAHAAGDAQGQGLGEGQRDGSMHSHTLSHEESRETLPAVDATPDSSTELSVYLQQLPPSSVVSVGVLDAASELTRDTPSPSHMRIRVGYAGGGSSSSKLFLGDATPAVPAARPHARLFRSRRHKLRDRPVQQRRRLFFSTTLEHLVNRVKIMGLLKERTLRFKTISDCLLAREVVDFLVTSRQCRTRGEAVELGKLLVDRGYFVNALGDAAPFGDDLTLFKLAAVPVGKTRTGGRNSLQPSVDVGINGEPIARTLARAIVQEEYFDKPRGRAGSGLINPAGAVAVAPGYNPDGSVGGGAASGGAGAGAGGGVGVGPGGGAGAVGSAGGGGGGGGGSVIEVRIGDGDGSGSAAAAAAGQTGDGSAEGGVGGFGGGDSAVDASGPGAVAGIPPTPPQAAYDTGRLVAASSPSTTNLVEMSVLAKPPSSGVLCCGVLWCAVVCCGAVLCCAVLCCAVLCCAVLCCAVLPCRAAVPTLIRPLTHSTSPFVRLCACCGACACSGLTRPHQELRDACREGGLPHEAGPQVQELEAAVVCAARPHAVVLPQAYGRDACGYGVQCADADIVVLLHVAVAACG